MTDFLRNWRRTMGYLLSLLAIISSLLWYRSSVNFDRFTFAVGARQYDFTSIGGHAWWCSWEPVTLPNMWGSSSKHLTALRVTQLLDATETEYRSMGGQWGARHKSSIWGTMYWPVTFSLALLAACLFLWPFHRGKKSQESAEGWLTN